jgi:hypothetical protein
VKTIVTKTPGQIAYEKELELMPTYHTGEPRRQWAELSIWCQQTWEADPEPRDIDTLKYLFGND